MTEVTENAPLTTLESLEQGRALIVERGWTQGCYGKDENGAKVMTGDLYEKATCFCGWGALQAVHRADGSANYRPGLYAAMASLDRAIPEPSQSPSGLTVRHFPTYNDTPGRTVEEVLAVFDTAIADTKAFLALCEKRRADRAAMAA